MDESRESIRARVLLSDDRLRALIVAGCRWRVFDGLPPDDERTYAAEQVRLAEWRALFETATTTQQIIRALWKLPPSWADRLPFERALRMLGRRIVLADAVLDRHSTGIYVDGRVRLDAERADA